MANSVRRGGLLAVLFSALILVSGCVVLDSPDKIAQVEETNDPFEPANRYIFEVNRFLHEFMLKPAAAWYNAALPQPAQDGVQRFFANLRLPWTAVNDFFQGRPDRVYVALARFVINSTVGVLGLFDPATSMGFPHHDEDSGQTFAAMGAPEGPYIMLPIFGPSNPRDAFGLFVVLNAVALLRVQRRPTALAGILVGLAGAGACLTRITSLSFLLPAYVYLLLVRGEGADARRRAQIGRAHV